MHYFGFHCVSCQTEIISVFRSLEFEHYKIKCCLHLLCGLFSLAYDLFYIHILYLYICIQLYTNYKYNTNCTKNFVFLKSHTFK